MDLTNIQNTLSYTDPIEMPVSELLEGTYLFSIPSYQRGYRWEASENGNCTDDVKQVDDLLNDLSSFVNQNVNNEGNYYLQPLMVKAAYRNSRWEWDVLDGQQRLTTMLLVLICLNEKLNISKQLYSISYTNRPNLDFTKITYDPNNSDFIYPKYKDNLDSYYVRMAKDRIYLWYDTVVQNNQSLKDGLKQALFYEDGSRNPNSNPKLRVKFIWYNVEPVNQSQQTVPIAPISSTTTIHDIEVFNRLNRGKISLTDSELIKALFLIVLKSTNTTSSAINPETFVRDLDCMGRQFQDNGFWSMLCPKEKAENYSNRLDLLFDIIRDKNKYNGSSYRYYYSKLHSNPNDLESLWNEAKDTFDQLCKMHYDVHSHNYIGFLVDCGCKISNIINSTDSLKEQTKKILYNFKIKCADDIDNLSYGSKAIRPVLLLFNVLTSDKYGQRFDFDLYRENKYDIEHVNSQTDNPIEKIDDKIDWIKNQALECLNEDANEKDSKGNPTQTAQDAEVLMKEGASLLSTFESSKIDSNDQFKPYRIKVESFYALGNANAQPDPNKDLIGNLTLLNAEINREYHNALFPNKLRILKRSDQEGQFIPLCTKYLFLKYYTEIKGNPSAFMMKRWRNTDQIDYTNAIKSTIQTIL